VGMGARQIARHQRQALAGEAFVAGLLHDIGYLVMLQHFPGMFEKSYQFAEERNVPLVHAEYALWGFSHAEIGSWLAEGWNLPEKIVKVIRFHHHPEKAVESSPLTNIIYFLEHLASTIDEGIRFKGVAETPEVDFQEQFDEFFKYGRTLASYQDVLRQEREKVSDFLATLFNKTQETASKSA